MRTLQTRLPPGTAMSKRSMPGSRPLAASCKSSTQASNGLEVIAEPNAIRARCDDAVLRRRRRDVDDRMLVGEVGAEQLQLPVAGADRSAGLDRVVAGARKARSEESRGGKESGLTVKSR